MAIKTRTNKHGLIEYGIDMMTAGRGSKRIRLWGFQTEKQAKDYEIAFQRERLKAKYGLAVEESPTLKELFAKHLETIPSKRERQRAQRVTDTLLATLPPQIHYVTDLATPDLELYNQARANDGVSPATIRRELTIISSAIHSAARHYRSLSQWIVPKIVYPRNSRKRRTRIIEPDEIRAILGWLLREREPGENATFFDARLRVGHVFLFGLLTAARLGEIAALKWKHVKLSRNIIEIHGTKTQFSKDTVRAREIEITPTLRGILDARPRTSEYVFFRGGNVPPKYYKILKLACDTVGVPYGKATENGIVTHTTRATAITQMIESGLDMGTVMNITGSSSQFVLWYFQKTNQQRQKAGQVLEASIAPLIR